MYGLDGPTDSIGPGPTAPTIPVRREAIGGTTARRQRHRAGLVARPGRRPAAGSIGVARAASPHLACSALQIARDLARHGRAGAGGRGRGGHAARPPASRAGWPPRWSDSPPRPRRSATATSPSGWRRPGYRRSTPPARADQDGRAARRPGRPGAGLLRRRLAPAADAADRAAAALETALDDRSGNASRRRWTPPTGWSGRSMSCSRWPATPRRPRPRRPARARPAGLAGRDRADRSLLITVAPELPGTPRRRPRCGTSSTSSRQRRTAWGRSVDTLRDADPAVALDVADEGPGVPEPAELFRRRAYRRRATGSGWRSPARSRRPRAGGCC